VLLGQLYGKYGTADQFTQKEHQSHAWSTDALINAALAHPEQNRMSKHIVLPSLAEQRIDTPASAPVGTAFDPIDVAVSLVGNMGDVIEVDLKDLIARRILGIAGKNTVEWNNMDARDQREALASIRAKIQELGPQVALSAGTDWDGFTDPARLAANRGGMQLVTEGRRANTPGSAPLITSRDENGRPSREYWKTGVFYLAPNITDADVELLRSGGRLADKQAEFTFYYQQRNAAGQMVWKEGLVRVKAQDYAATGREVFFGDRPLNNPGYSTMTLSGEVGVGKANDKLDVFRVEQRLRYLGFPAMGSSRQGQPSRTNNTIQEFKVDGACSRRGQGCAPFQQGRELHAKSAQQPTGQFSSWENKFCRAELLLEA
jgi:hypothetical protein